MSEISSILVIFGGNGDLTKRKLFPALYNLLSQELLLNNFAVVSVSRTKMTDEDYITKMKESIKEFSRFEYDESVFKELKKRVKYISFDFSSDEGYKNLKLELEKLDSIYKTDGRRIYYLAVAPEYFRIIVEKLKLHKMADDSGKYRVVIEKPFGKDLHSARCLNETITEAFSEKNIYRIDHYLGKEMIQNIMVLRFANFFIESLWSNKYIDNVQISALETVGVENRGGYYDSAGALKDMVQNHILQLLTLVAMEPPVRLDTESIRDEKLKVLKSLMELTPEYIKDNVVRGQYDEGYINGVKVPKYRDEYRVKHNSNTETYVALKLFVNNYRWDGVPFYIRTGKRTNRKLTEVVIQFKNMPKILYYNENKNIVPNVLVIKIQPDEGIYFQFNAKEPGSVSQIIPVKMDFCHSCIFGGNTPESYERLLLDSLKGDSTLFTRWDEVEYSWKFVDAISTLWLNESIDFPNYKAGSIGPKEAENLIKRDNREWWSR
ncbi:Glucose-6-phosphate 1-dehydrogenase [Caloramator mitchellensis]|uniref:Glucose-6-phosphate 1-dehydrogenase n=1 Tax=Caloramator mitchellensis TaxID=908809 RepID=A0A0R3JVP5_CALMK|nr:glucose-6-phosphate dehydrogenase [Caloramator mitchellensis]KRQ86381.1 Glucose-6-phosphate 1-dehydrogenase [Caloramator mitchellensis]